MPAELPAIEGFVPVTPPLVKKTAKSKWTYPTNGLATERMLILLGMVAGLQFCILGGIFLTFNDVKTPPELYYLGTGCFSALATVLSTSVIPYQVSKGVESK